MEKGNAFCLNAMKGDTSVNVLSDDNFLRTGIIAFCDKYRINTRHRHISFIDVDGMTSFNELSKAIMSVDEKSSVVGILRNGIFSRQLHNTASFHMTMTMSNIAMSLHKSDDALFRQKNWVSRLRIITDMPDLPGKQKEVFRTLQSGADVYGIARHFNISVKTSYSHIRSLSEYFNVRTIHELYFLAQKIHAYTA